MLISRRRRVMSWRRVGKSVQALVAHALLFSFTLLLSLKLQRALPYSWWFVFFSILLCFFYVSKNMLLLVLLSIWVLTKWDKKNFIRIHLGSQRLIFCLHVLVQSLYIWCFEEGIAYKCCEIDWNTWGCV